MGQALSDAVVEGPLCRHDEVGHIEDLGCSLEPPVESCITIPGSMGPLGTGQFETAQRDRIGAGTFDESQGGVHRARGSDDRDHVVFASEGPPIQDYGTCGITAEQQGCCFQEGMEAEIVLLGGVVEHVGRKECRADSVLIERHGPCPGGQRSRKGGLSCAGETGHRDEHIDRGLQAAVAYGLAEE